MQEVDSLLGRQLRMSDTEITISNFIIKMEKQDNEVVKRIELGQEDVDSYP